VVLIGVFRAGIRIFRTDTAERCSYAEHMSATGMRAPAARVGLRERKKQKTRQAIVEVAARLFSEQGYSDTPLAQVAEEAEVALSTIFNYFPGKPDIVFAGLDEIIRSAHERVVERPEGEPAVDAVVSWVGDVLPEVERPYTTGFMLFPQVIAAEPELHAEERLRVALLEDELAKAFARDLGEAANGMRARVLAAIAVGGMVDVWNDWYAHHAGVADVDLTEVTTLKADYLRGALAAGLQAIQLLPPQPGGA
jgi:AcrR family transcriptional regulator